MTLSDVNPLKAVMMSLSNESFIRQKCDTGIHISELGPEGLDNTYYCLYDTASPDEIGHGTGILFKNVAAADSFHRSLKYYSSECVLKPIRRWDTKTSGNNNVRFLIYSQVFTTFGEWISKYPSKSKHSTLSDEIFYQMFRKFGKVLVHYYEKHCLDISLDKDIVITNGNDVFLLHPGIRDPTEKKGGRVDPEHFYSFLQQLIDILGLMTTKLNDSKRVEKYKKFLERQKFDYELYNMGVAKELKQHSLGKDLLDQILKYPTFWTKTDDLRFICTIYHLSRDAHASLSTNIEFLSHASNWQSWHHDIRTDPVLKSVFDHKPSFYIYGGGVTLCEYSHNLMKHHREKSQKLNNKEYTQFEVLDMLLRKRECLVEDFYEALFHTWNARCMSTKFSIEEMFNAIIGA